MLFNHDLSLFGRATCKQNSNSVQHPGISRESNVFHFLERRAWFSTFSVTLDYPNKKLLKARGKTVLVLQ